MGLGRRLRGRGGGNGGGGGGGRGGGGSRLTVGAARAGRAVSLRAVARGFAALAGGRSAAVGGGAGAGVALAGGTVTHCPVVARFARLAVEVGAVGGLRLRRGAWGRGGRGAGGAR